MSNCCKGACWTRFLPHNWLCLKGLYVLFVVLFYLAVAFAIYIACQLATYPMLSGREFWMALVVAEAQILSGALAALTVSKILKALAKIKHAVAPCCCHDDAAAEKPAKKAKKEDKAN